MVALRVVLWPARETWRTARWAERRMVGASARVTLLWLDVALRSPYADEAVRRIAKSDLAERSVDWALAAGVPQRLAARLVESELVEDACTRLVEDVLGRLDEPPALTDEPPPAVHERVA